MSKAYWLKGITVIGVLAVGILVIGLAKLNRQREFIASSVIATPLAKANVNKSIEEEKIYVPKVVACPAQLPDLEELYQNTPRIKENWDAQTIGIVKGYKYWLGKGVLELKSGMVVGGNTPINTLSTTVYTGFNFPSLRGGEDESFLTDRREYLSLHKVDKRDVHYIPEAEILVSINRVPDWSNLPMTKEIKFWKIHYKPNLTVQQIEQARKEHKVWLEKDQPINHVGDSEQFGLKEIIARRSGMFYYEPSNNTNPSPYGLPRFVCDGATSTVSPCIGHIKMDKEYLVTYSLPQMYMKCWQQVEEGVRRVVHLNTQAVK